MRGVDGVVAHVNALDSEHVLRTVDDLFDDLFPLESL